MPIQSHFYFGGEAALKLPEPAIIASLGDLAAYASNPPQAGMVHPPGHNFVVSWTPSTHYPGAWRELAERGFEISTRGALMAFVRLAMRDFTKLEAGEYPVPVLTHRSSIESDPTTPRQPGNLTIITVGPHVEHSGSMDSATRANTVEGLRRYVGAALGDEQRIILDNVYSEDCFDADGTLLRVTPELTPLYTRQGTLDLDVTQRITSQIDALAEG